MKLAIVLLTICFIACLFYKLYQTVINFDPYEAKQKTTPEDPTESIYDETQPGQYRIGRKGAKN